MFHTQTAIFEYVVDKIGQRRLIIILNHNSSFLKQFPFCLPFLNHLDSIGRNLNKFCLTSSKFFNRGKKVIQRILELLACYHFPRELHVTPLAERSLKDTNPQHADTTSETRKVHGAVNIIEVVPLEKLRKVCLHTEWPLPLLDHLYTYCFFYVLTKTFAIPVFTSRYS